MSRIVLTGGNGSSGQTGQDIIDAINAMTLELYGNPETVLVPSADSDTASTVAADIPGLSMTVLENSVYAIIGQVIVGNNDSTNGVKLGFVSPSGASYTITVQGSTTGSAAFTRQMLQADGLSSSTFATPDITLPALGGNVSVLGTITLGAGEGGTFKMQFATGSGTGPARVFKEGTMLMVKKIA